MIWCDMFYVLFVLLRGLFILFRMRGYEFIDMDYFFLCFSIDNVWICNCGVDLLEFLIFVNLVCIVSEKC